MPTSQEKQDAMLDEFQKTHQTDTTDPGKQRRELIEPRPA
jgi:hypothetical protein